MPVYDKHIKHGMAGIYIITPELNLRHNIGIQFKLGRSIHLKDRLNQYHICFNHGFHIEECLIVNNDNYNEPRSEEMKNDLLEKTTRLEDIFHEELSRPVKKKGRKKKYFNDLTDTRLRKSEWFVLTLKELEEKVKVAIEKYGGVLDAV